LLFKQLVTAVKLNVSVVLNAVNLYQELFSIVAVPPQKSVDIFPGLSGPYVEEVVLDHEPGPCVN
jgi:hypothetical protein